LIESLQYKPYIVKPNLFEFASTFAPELVKDNDLADYEKARQKIRSVLPDLTKKYGCSIILTNGSRNIIAVNSADKTSGEKLYEVKIPAVKAVNTVGCGDAFTAGFAGALDDGASFEDAVNEGIRCGALNAGLLRPGVIK
jgi:1-phosphofructokinase/tagatose 6-phosphate kinase